jgi:DNA-directed RNA polymerase specialized sigma24 family protein
MMRSYSIAKTHVHTASPEQAHAIQLLWEAGLDTEEIAVRLRLPESVVYNTRARMVGASRG